MTQHQAPEVTSELAGCPFPECDGTRPAIDLAIGDYEGEQTCQAYVECDCGARGPMTPTYVGILAACRAKQEAARLWNTRATQPLSLTVDEVRIAEREACAKVAENMPRLIPLPDKIFPAHDDKDDFGNPTGLRIREVRMQRSRSIRGSDIAAAIRARGDRVDDISYAGLANEDQPK